MPTPLYYPPLDNGLQKTLGSDLLTGVTASVTLSDTNRIQDQPGIFVVDRIDTNGDLKSSAVKEYVSYAATSGSTLTTLVRALGGSTDQDHSTGAVVEFVPDISVFQSIISALAILVDPDDISAYNSAIATLTGTQTLTNKTLTAPQVGGDMDLDDATGNITVQAADPYRTITLPSSTWSPTTTGGCAAIATVEAGTNDIDYKVLDFDTSTDERAFTNFQMPASWDAGVVQFRYVWTNAAGLTTETVAFDFAGRAYADSDAIDQALGTAVELSDTWLAQNDVHISAWSGDVTLGGTPAAEQWVHLEIKRDVSSDDLTGDARLMEVQVRYKQDQFTD